MTSCCKTKILNRLWEKFIIFNDLCMKGHHFATPQRALTPEKYIILASVANSLLLKDIIHITGICTTFAISFNQKLYRYFVLLKK